MSENNIHNIVEGMPHFTIVGLSGDVYVVPVRVIERMAEGELTLFPNNDKMGKDTDLILGIIKDWLRYWQQNS